MALSELERINRKLGKFFIEKQQCTMKASYDASKQSLKSCYAISGISMMVGLNKDAGVIDIHMRNMIQEKHDKFKMDMIKTAHCNEVIGGIEHEVRGTHYINIRNYKNKLMTREQQRAHSYDQT